MTNGRPGEAPGAGFAAIVPMYRLARITFGLALPLLFGCATTPHGSDIGGTDPGEPGSIFDLAGGTWDEARGDSTCLGNRHTVTFSPDRAEMLLTYEQPLDTLTGKSVYRYTVLASGEGLDSGQTRVIRAAMEDEHRTTATGEPVVWDMVFAHPNRYHWHRTDWPRGAVSNAMIRCDGRRPLERWEPPSRARRNVALAF